MRSSQKNPLGVRNTDGINKRRFSHAPPKAAIAPPVQAGWTPRYRFGEVRINHFDQWRLERIDRQDRVLAATEREMTTRSHPGFLQQRCIFLTEGNDRVGRRHMQRHLEEDFPGRGLGNPDQVIDLIMQALTESDQVGIKESNKGFRAPILQVQIKDRLVPMVAVVSPEGMLVTAYPLADPQDPNSRDSRRLQRHLEAYQEEQKSGFRFDTPVF